MTEEKEIIEEEEIEEEDIDYGDEHEVSVYNLGLEKGYEKGYQKALSKQKQDFKDAVEKILNKYEKDWKWLLSPDYKNVNYNLLIKLREELLKELDGK